MGMEGFTVQDTLIMHVPGLRPILLLTFKPGLDFSG